VVGQPLALTILASDRDQDALNFSAAGLPASATLSSSPAYGQAVINWTPMGQRRGGLHGAGDGVR